MSQYLERPNNTGESNSWAVRRSIQKWLQNSCEGILTQWLGQLLDFELLHQERIRNIHDNVSRASKLWSKSVQICGRRHSHSDKVAPESQTKIINSIYWLLEFFRLNFLLILVSKFTRQTKETWFKSELINQNNNRCKF